MQSKSFALLLYLMDRAHRNKKGNGLRMYAQDTEWACQKVEEVVDTLQAAKPPCSVSNGP